VYLSGAFAATLPVRRD